MSWSRRFADLVESFGMEERLRAGRSLARTGGVLTMTISTSVVIAQVRGSQPEPAKVRVALRAFTRVQWARVEAELAGRAGHCARLLAGELPEDIEEVFATVDLRPLPEAPGEMSMDCTCLDWGVPCEHLAAVLYLLAESFDTDPFGLLAWRGRGRDELLTRLRELRAGEHARQRHAPEEPTLADHLDAFWTAPTPGEPGFTERLPVDPAGEPPPDAILDQLGPSGIIVDGRDLTEALRPLYRAMRRSSRSG